MYLLQEERGTAVRAVRLRAAAIAASVIAADQVTKALVVANIPEGSSRPLIGEILRLSHFRNTGAAFGMLRGFAGLLALIALVGVVIFAGVVIRHPAPLAAYGAALVASGATGNLIDRFTRSGGVVDFVDLSFWPAFNVADSAIFIGAAVLVFSGAFDKTKDGSDAERS